MSKDYYNILGISKDASKEDIKKAYKKLAKKYHPDISKEENAEQKFKDINEAASVLLDDNKRQNYDNFGTADGQGFSGFSSSGFDPNDFGINLDDIFEQFGFSGFSGSGFSQRNSRHNQKDTRLYYETQISLEDVYFGVKKDIEILRDVMCENCQGVGTKNKQDVEKCSNCLGSGVVVEMQRSILGNIRTQRTCPMCHGSGETIKNPCSSCHGEKKINKKEKIQIDIPKGVEDSMALRVSGKGNYDVLNKSYGDLILRIYVKEDKNFKVDGQDLQMDLKINFIQAILGDEIEFDYFDKTLSLKVPASTQPNTILRLKNKGLPYFNYDNKKGDLYVKIIVEIPKKTTIEQKKILHDYAKTLKDKSFLNRIKSLFKN